MESIDSLISNDTYRSDWSTVDAASLKTAGANRVYLVSKAGGVARILLVRNSDGQYEPPVASMDQINEKLIYCIHNAAKQTLTIDANNLKVLSGFKTPSTIIEDDNSFDKQWNSYATDTMEGNKLPDFVLATIGNIESLLNNRPTEFARFQGNRAEIKVKDWFIPLSIDALMSLKNYNKLIGHN